MRGARTGWPVLAGAVLSLAFGSDRRGVQADETPPPLLELERSDFLAALERPDLESRALPEELWPILERCRQEPQGETDTEREEPRLHRAYLCARVGEALARSSAPDEADRVLDLFDTLSAADPLREALLAGLLAGRLAEAVRDLAPDAPPAALRLPLPPLPDRLAEASPELQRAWQVKEALELAYRSRLEEVQKAGEVTIFEGRAEFQASIAEFLRGRSPAARTVSSVGRFVGGRTCGTGFDSLVRPQSGTLFLAFRALGDPDAAAGALLATSGWGAFDSGALPEGVERELLVGLGFDWEQIFLGLVLDGDPLAARSLARDGSDRAARLLFEARSVRRYDDQPALGNDDGYLHALAALVSPTERCSAYATSSSRDLVRGRDAESIGADLEVDVLRLLESHAGPGTGQGEAETAAHLLASACRTESLPAFREMVRSPYSRVREAGALALRALGEPAPTPRPNRPVAFTVSVDGAPFRGGRVGWALARASGGQLSSSGTTADDGTLLLEGDPFLDPKDAVKTVTLSTNDLETPNALWFAVRVPRPKRLDRPVLIEVTTQSLTVVCPEVEPGTLTVSIQAPTFLGGEPDMLDMFFPILGDVQLGRGPLTFARLQRGRYQVRLQGSSGYWESDEITLGAHSLTVTCGPLQAW